jgi:hypothetical protein
MNGDSFEFKGVSAGEYFIETGIDDGARVIRRRIAVLSDQAANVRFDFATDASASLAGVVFRDGVPLPDVRVILRRVIDTDATLVLFATTGAAGSYLFANLPAGKCEIEVVAEDIGHRGSDRFVTEVVVVAGSSTRQDIETSAAVR